MLRVLSVAWALVAVVAMGFVPPARPHAQASDGATIGVVGVSGAAPALSARRVRAKVAQLGGQTDGGHPIVWSHVLWLATTPRPLVSRPAVGTVALAGPPQAPPSISGGARTSRGPPPRS
jgi:hypothetical protein